MDKLFKGTKGKWVLWNDGYAFDVVKESDAIMTIACVYDGKEAENDIDVVVAKANAQLIAAAPELLDAIIETDKDLCVLEGNMAQIEKSDPRADGMTTLVSEWRKRNKKAINKALGK